MVAIHAWVFMTNHVHLLVTPVNTNSIQFMMQSLGRRYVRYFNYTYRRTGTLWEGRYKSSLVQTETWLLHCQRYIELNPVRAGLVRDPSDYPWSSYRCNGMGMESELYTPHDEYLKLGRTKIQRLQAYRSLFKAHVTGELLEAIRCTVNQGLALGNERFKDEIEALYGRRVRPAKLGRPGKSLI